MTGTKGAYQSIPSDIGGRVPWAVGSSGCHGHSAGRAADRRWCACDRCYIIAALRVPKRLLTLFKMRGGAALLRERSACMCQQQRHIDLDDMCACVCILLFIVIIKKSLLFPIMVVYSHHIYIRAVQLRIILRLHKYSLCDDAAHMHVVYQHI